MAAVGIRSLLRWWLRDVQVARLVNQGDLLPDSMILEVCYSGKLSCLICTYTLFMFFKFGIYYVQCLT